MKFWGGWHGRRTRAEASICDGGPPRKAVPTHATHAHRLKSVATKPRAPASEGGCYTRQVGQPSVRSKFATLGLA
jgi:hypothetical protein